MYLEELCRQNLEDQLHLLPPPYLNHLESNRALQPQVLILNRWQIRQQLRQIQLLLQVKLYVELAETLESRQPMFL